MLSLNLLLIACTAHAGSNSFSSITSVDFDVDRTPLSADSMIEFETVMTIPCFFIIVLVCLGLKETAVALGAFR